MSESNKLTKYEENIYNCFLKSSRKNKGYTPRKNFKNLDDEKYVIIKKISKTLKNKKIDPQLFFDAPYKLHNENFINFKYFSTFAAIRSYRTYTEQLELTDPDNLFNITRLRNSMKFIYQECIDNNLDKTSDYLQVQKGIYPNYILDLKKDNISFYSLISLGLSEENINLEKNIVEFAKKGFYNMLSSLRSRYVFSKKIKPLSIKLIKTIDKILKNDN
tara:strand:- start:165 stop:818 length:654 start_codon:yes stop_codon:yes gene_type:complete